MKKLLIILCIASFLMTLSGCQANQDQNGQPQRFTEISTTDDAETKEAKAPEEAVTAPAEELAVTASPSPGYAVNLQVDGGFLSLVIPEKFKLQPEEIQEWEQYPDRYFFTDENTESELCVGSALDDQKSQAHLLRKVYDPTLKFIVENIIIGEHPFIVFTHIEDTYYLYHFLLKTDNGYSYQFSYRVVPSTFHYEIPEEAIAILSTLKIIN